MLMDISLHHDYLNVRTPFSPRWDLIQIFSGVRGGILTHNSPVDFHAAGLQRHGHGDIWHIDTALAYCTDETTPLFINGEDIGGNHSFPCGVEITVPHHGKTTGDIGTLWQDESGLLFTLVRISGERLTLISENLGPSKNEFHFADAASGTLSSLDDPTAAPLVPLGQRGKLQLGRSNRHVRCDLFYEKDGVRFPISGYHTSVDSALIEEEYEVINPATMAGALREARPAGGYTSPPDLAVGEAMFRYRMTFRILGDGTVLCDFDHTVLSDVCFHGYLGVMYQEKCDAFGGGLRRYIPGVCPFEDSGVRYDFSRPVNTTEGPFPRWHRITPDEWADPELPPSRQIDLFCREDGTAPVAFSGGFLPVYDGHPARRRENIADATTIVSSRKSYPTFSGGDPFTGLDTTRHQSGARGVGFKKYFVPGDGHSVFSVASEGVTYLYGDFYEGKPARRHIAVPEDAAVTVLEKTGDACFERNGGEIVIFGSRGTLVLAY